MIELNKEYSYSELCRELGWTESTGRQKQRQIKAVEEAYKFFHPENTKTHKLKKSYIFTEKIKELVLSDGRKSNGAEYSFPQEEFEYLLNCMLLLGKRRNIYFQRGNMNEVYLSGSLIFKSFGIDIYSELDDINYKRHEKAINELFRSICIDAVKSNSIVRICKKFGYPKNSLPKGILRQEGKTGKAAEELVPANELQESYDKRIQGVLKLRRCNDLRDAVMKGKYLDVIESVAKIFERIDKKYGVKQYNVITFEGDLEFKIDDDLRMEYQEHFRQVIYDSIEKSIQNRILGKKEYKFKLNEYSKLLLQNYLDQLLGRTMSCLEDDRREYESNSISDEQMLKLLDELD